MDSETHNCASCLHQNLHSLMFSTPNFPNQPSFHGWHTEVLPGINLKYPGSDNSSCGEVLLNNFGPRGEYPYTSFSCLNRDRWTQKHRMTSGPGPDSKSGWWFEPLWKIWKSVGMNIPTVCKHQSHVPVTRVTTHRKCLGPRGFSPTVRPREGTSRTRIGLDFPGRHPIHALHCRVPGSLQHGHGTDGCGFCVDHGCAVVDGGGLCEPEILPRNMEWWWMMGMFVDFWCPSSAKNHRILAVFQLFATVFARSAHRSNAVPLFRDAFHMLVWQCQSTTTQLEQCLQELQLRSKMQWGAWNPYVFSLVI